mgnify:CR=1 FL=1
MGHIQSQNNKMKKQQHNGFNRPLEIKCVQINLQHSKKATYNLTQLLQEKNIDVAFLQEPYTISNKVAGFPKSLKIFIHGNGRKRTAIIINNDNIDGIAINQISDEDCIVMEFTHRELHFYGASIYCDCDDDIGKDIEKAEKIIKLANGKGLLLALDTNARSKTWYDVTMNQRGKTFEEFLLTNNLYLANENTGIPTFESTRGRSWIDLTLSNGILAKKIRNWSCGLEESCSDHNLIRFNIGSSNLFNEVPRYFRSRYLIKTEDFEKFGDKLTSNLKSTFGVEGYDELSMLDEILSNTAKN